MTVRCDKCCTTTSLGRPRQRCPATTDPLMMCLTASASRTGHGTDSRFETPRLNFEPVRHFHICHCGGNTRPAERVDPPCRRSVCEQRLIRESDVTPNPGFPVRGRLRRLESAPMVVNLAAGR